MNSEILSRKIFFWTLFTLFWLISAIILGYTFGYRFSFQKGIFIYGGSVTLKTTPQLVDIFLDGVQTPSGMLNVINKSYHIDGIKPGEHFIEVRASGYKTWSKKISVHSGVSTEFWNIILVQNSYESEDYESAGIVKFFISPNEDLVAFPQQIENNFSVNILNPETSGVINIFSSLDHVFTNDKKENIEWSPQAHKIIVPTLSNEEKKYLIINVEEEDISDLGNLSGMDNISNVRWDPKNKDVLFFMSGNNLYRIDTKSIENKKLIAENIANYDLSQKHLFYFQLPEGMVYKTTFDASEKPTQITFSAPDDMTDNLYKIIVYDEDRIVFLNKSGKLYIYNKGKENVYFNKLSENADGSQFSDDGKKLLYWTNNEIFTYFVREWEVQPIRTENEIMPITLLTDSIKNVQWTRDYEHVLFTNNDKIKMIEIDNRDNRNMTDLMSLNDSDSIIINNFTDEKLYYTEKNEQGQNTLHSIYFPERATLLQNLLPGNKPSNNVQ